MTHADATPAQTPPARSRVTLAACLVIIITVGLLSRLDPTLRQITLSKEFGDTLWAMMFYLWFALLRPRSTIAPLTVATLAITFTIEFLKLVRLDWLDALRAHPVSGMMLGHTFYWHDLLCYILGAGVAVALDRVVLRPRK